MNIDQVGLADCSFSSSSLFRLLLRLSAAILAAWASIPPKQMVHISYYPYFQKIYKCTPIFVQFASFFLIYVFASPYFDHDAFTHLALHVHVRLCIGRVYLGLTTMFAVTKEDEAEKQ